MLVVCQTWFSFWLIPLSIIFPNTAYFSNFHSTFFLLTPFWCCSLTPIWRRHFTSSSFAGFRCWWAVSSCWDPANGSSSIFPTSLCSTIIDVSSLSSLTDYFLVHVAIQKRWMGKRLFCRSYPCCTRKFVRTFHATRRWDDAHNFILDQPGHIFTRNEKKQIMCFLIAL